MMARDKEQKQAQAKKGDGEMRQMSTGTVTADDIRRLVAKLKGEEVKK
jgi:hypothetical protein